MSDLIVLPNGQEHELEEDTLWYMWVDDAKVPYRLTSIGQEWVRLVCLNQYLGSADDVSLDAAQFVQFVERGTLLPMVEGVEEIRREAMTPDYNERDL